MLKHLVSLADFLDKKGKSKEANIIDAFIIRAQNMADVNTEIYNNSISKFPISEGVFFDLNSELGQMILSYINRVFKVADEGIAGEISAKDINSIIDVAIRTNADSLKVYPDMDSNPNPISPAQFRIILGEARKYAGEYTPRGHFNLGTVSDFLESLYKSFEDTYLEDYMGLESSEKNFMYNDPGIRRVIDVDPERAERANREQDIHEQKMIQQQWFRDLEQDSRPERYEKRIEREKEALKEDTPESWHNTILPPE